MINSPKIWEMFMSNIRNKNRLKIILKLIVVVPLFYYIGIYVGNDIINGNYTSMLLLILVWNMAGFVLAKI